MSLVRGVCLETDRNDLLITLNGAYRSEGGDFEEPTNDYFVIVDLSIDNNGENSEMISTMLQMSLLDDDGYSQDMALTVKQSGPSTPALSKTDNRRVSSEKDARQASFSVIHTFLFFILGHRARGT